MQLHACLLVVIITTDKTLALSQHLCGEDVSLDQEPSGHINLTLPGLFTDSTDRPQTVTHHSHEATPASVCTWTLNIPLGRTVLLKLVWLGNSSSISIRCVWNEKDLILESGGGTALLSGCDGNKATLYWTGEGWPSNAIELSYYVQEDDTHSTEDHTNPYSIQDLLHWSQTGTSFTRTSPIGQEFGRGTVRSRGQIYESEETSSGPYFSSQNQGLLHPTAPLQGLATTGKADRETLPFPEEELNNGTDASGAAHLADSPTSAQERTHPYFHSTDSFFHDLNTENTETDSRNEHETHTDPTHETRSSSNTLNADKHTSAPSVSSSSIPHFNTSLSGTTSMSKPVSTLPNRVVFKGPGEKLSPSWRSHRSTDVLDSDTTSAVTSSPLKSPTKPPEEGSTSSNTDTESTVSSLSSSSQGPSMVHSSTTPVTDINTAVSTLETASFHPNMSPNGSSLSAFSDFRSQTDAFEPSDKLEITQRLQTFTPSSSLSQTDIAQSTESGTQMPYTTSPLMLTSQEEAKAAAESTQSNLKAISFSPDITKADEQTFSFTDSSLGDAVQSSAVNLNTEAYTQSPTFTLFHDNSATVSQTSAYLLSTSTSTDSSTRFKTVQTYSAFPGTLGSPHTTSPLPSTTTQSTAQTSQNTMPTTSEASTIRATSAHKPHTQSQLPSTDIPATHKQTHGYFTTAQTSAHSLSTVTPEDTDVEVEKQDESWQQFPSSTTSQTTRAGQPAPYTTQHPSREKRTTLATSVLDPRPTLNSTTGRTPKFFIVPDQPADIRVEYIELLLQIIVEESRSTLNPGLEDDTTAWMEPYLHKAPGFSRLLGVWSSGHAVQSLVQFKTSGALQWLSSTVPTSLLERTGLSQAVQEGKKFRSSKISNITVGGVQADVCDWLLQCPVGYKCVSQPGSSNYSCSSVCHYDYCHHHGICTHHPGQPPVCRCLVGEDFWYMGQRCDVRMTRTRLVGACLAILLIMVTVIGVLALVAVRRYKAALIQAKVDQTRSSYRRFNHFDELSGRFWLRSWAGSADSLDNPAFTRSDELLHLRALDRPCCYHDDTLSLASTCPSHGTRINTIYPHSSQYGLRGSEVSMGDGVLDSGKASDLSVCSWPVEPIQWTPFPLLQQLASHRTPTVRVSRPRSYCEGMELVDISKSWTA
ncbi:interphotoreceptor matrix proteoglycan 2 [Cheilinus undulatus]|uniref:interphotoreceptor matrix proteoglycan 2 n=1 Tax=Cheilinus undulatus TaxID=241271 RepID=UPI001BD2078F|nr:interphotoreceptor matrix proteoglycan 2 [Cheilinus undulatus]